MVNILIHRTAPTTNHTRQLRRPQSHRLRPRRSVQLNARLLRRHLDRPQPPGRQHRRRRVLPLVRRLGLQRQEPPNAQHRPWRAGRQHRRLLNVRHRLSAVPRHRQRVPLLRARRSRRALQFPGQRSRSPLESHKRQTPQQRVRSAPRIQPVPLRPTHRRRCLPATWSMPAMPSTTSKPRQ
jgi:hypothetical protein